jgi:hypothetical protein
MPNKPLSLKDSLWINFMREQKHSVIIVKKTHRN